MTNMKVIIPAAKIVPEELQKLGKLPGIIYPVNQKICMRNIKSIALQWILFALKRRIRYKEG